MLDRIRITIEGDSLAKGMAKGIATMARGFLRVLHVMLSRGGFHGGPGGPMAPLSGKGPSSHTPQAPFHYNYLIIISLFFRNSPLEFILS